jgi:hypothetical protein
VVPQTLLISLGEVLSPLLSSESDNSPHVWMPVRWRGTQQDCDGDEPEFESQSTPGFAVSWRGNKRGTLSLWPLCQVGPPYPPL